LRQVKTGGVLHDSDAQVVAEPFRQHGVHVPVAASEQSGQGGEDDFERYPPPETRIQRTMSVHSCDAVDDDSGNSQQCQRHGGSSDPEGQTEQRESQPFTQHDAKHGRQVAQSAGAFAP